MVIALLSVAALAVASPSVSSADLVEAADISSLSVSPDGTLVAFRVQQPTIGDNQIHLRWFVVPVDGSAPARLVADGGAPELLSGAVLPQAPIWAPSSRAIFFRGEFNGQTQVWRAAVDGGSARQVTTEAADVRSLSLSPDGRSLAYEIGATRDQVERAEQDALDRGVLIDGKVDVTSPLTKNGYYNGHLATLRFVKGWFLREPLLWDENLQAKTVALEKADATGTVTANASSITSRIDVSGAARTLRATGPDKIDRVCSSKLCREAIIEAAVPMQNGQDVFVTTRDIAYQEALSIWTPSTGRFRTLVSEAGMLDGGSVLGDSACSVAKRVLVCVSAKPSAPPQLVSLDLSSGRINALFDPNPALRARTWPSQTVVWKTSKGVPLSGQLFLPQATKPKSGYPLVLNYYSCPGFLKGGLGDELPLAPLAQAGIATLCINEARIPRTSERALEDTAVDAASSIVAKLSNQGLVDRTRVGMSGLSFGSGVALAVAERTSLLRAVVISSGQIEPAYYWDFRLPGLDIRDELKNYYGVGDPETDKLGWKENVPVGHVDAIKAPLFIQIPESEMRITLEFYSKLAASQTPTEMIAYPNEMHIKWEPRNKLAVYDRNLDWFRFWLLGAEDPDPTKAEQYRRWEAFATRPGYALPKVGATP